MKKKLILAFLVIPNLTLASIAEDLNSLLEKFFNETPQEISEKEEDEKIIIPENPTKEDIDSFQKKLEEEIAFLENSEKNINEKEISLWKLRTERENISQTISFLDQSISLNQGQIEKIESQKNIWEKKLEILTREKSALESMIRVQEEELKKKKTENEIRSSVLGKESDLSTIMWIFSNKTISEILQENEKIENEIENKTVLVQKLKNNKKILNEKTRHASMLVAKIREMEEKIKAEKAVLSDFAEAKANILAQKEYSEGKIAQELDIFRKQQEEAQKTIESLKEGIAVIENQLKDSESEIQNKEEAFLFPLPIEKEITAKFKDPKYQETFGIEHDGIDILAPQGTEIKSPLSGKVVRTVDNGYGYSYIILEHKNKLYTIYGHVSEILVTEGQNITQGQKIGLTGGTPGTKGAGYFTAGPHLHFGVFQGGEFKDPENYLPK